MSQVMREERRRQAMRALDYGTPIREIAEMYCVSLRSVQRWARAYRSGGVPAIMARPIPGRRRRLDESQLAEVLGMIGAPPEAAGYPGVKWSHALVARAIRERFGRTYSRGYIGRLLRKAAPQLPPPPPPGTPEPELEPAYRSEPDLR